MRRATSGCWGGSPAAGKSPQMITWWQLKHYLVSGSDHSFKYVRNFHTYLLSPAPPPLPGWHHLCMRHLCPHPEASRWLETYRLWKSFWSISRGGERCLTAPLTRKANIWNSDQRLRAVWRTWCQAFSIHSILYQHLERSYTIDIWCKGFKRCL